MHQQQIQQITSEAMHSNNSITGVQIAPQYQPHLRVPQNYNTAHQQQPHHIYQNNIVGAPSSSSTPSSSKSNVNNVRLSSNLTPNTSQLQTPISVQSHPPPLPPSLNMRTLRMYNISFKTNSTINL